MRARAAWRLGAAAVLAAGCLAGCAAGTTVAPGRGLVSRLCAARGAPPQLPEPARPAPASPTLSEADRAAAAAALAAQGWSPTAVEVAEVIGARDLLLRLGAAQAEAAAAPRRAGSAAAQGAELRVLRLRQAIADRVLAAMLDVSVILAELDCEGERGDQLQRRLQAEEARRTRRLTLASILAGALTAGVTGGLGLAGAGTAGSIAGIVGGGGEAGLAASLLTGRASGPLRTPRNPLGEVWRRPARSELFPESVWRYLTLPHGAGPIGGQGGGGEATVADAVVAAWRGGDRFGPPGSEEERARIALLFGPGGTYTVEDLEAREAMIELLTASVALMSRDLRAFLAELQARAALAPAGGAGP